MEILPSDHILFQNQFLAVIERDGYTFSREVRCAGAIIALLPFRSAAGEPRREFLARLEVCPAHGPEINQCSVTGGLEPGLSAEATACLELEEETGYQAEERELIKLGTVRPSKSSDTIVYLFAVDVTGKPSSTPKTDGTRFEANSSVDWVTYEQGLQNQDPLFLAALIRLQHVNLIRR